MADTEQKEKAAGMKTVFIIEDDVFLVKVYQVKFRELGAEVWTASDGKVALERLLEAPPNVILLDLMLPGASGFDILAAIRKNERWKNVPVFVLTNLGQPEDIQRGKELGADDYIVKANLRIDDVVEKVKKYL